MIAAAPPVDTASATIAPSTGVTGASGFDAILLLQGWAANPALEAAAFEPADTSDALGGDDAADDDTDDDIDASLAFLANLIAATSSPASSTPFEGGGGQGGSEPGSTPPLALDADAFVLAAAVAEGGDEKADALQGLTAVEPEALESRPAVGDAAQNLARAAELLAQSPRAVAETSKLVATHVRDPRWADDFGARLSLMVRAGESTASLQLTPVDLGPVEVSVSVKDSQATIHFGATQADTRALIEASLPKLRELLASQGFNLLDASVSSGFSRSQQSANTSSARSAIESDTPTTETQPTRSLGLLDLYA